LSLCENEHILTDSPSINEEYSFFWKYLHDQSILSLLYLKHLEKVLLIGPDETYKYFGPHKRRKADHFSVLLKFLRGNGKMTFLERGLDEIMNQLGLIPGVRSWQWFRGSGFESNRYWEWKKNKTDEKK